LYPPSRGRVSLLELWTEHFAEHQPARYCCCEELLNCRAVAVQQTFLEREPAVLILQLERVQTDAEGQAVKTQALGDFPMVLDFMRSGPYTLCGLVRHHGDSSSSGHYDAFCAVASSDGDTLAPSFGYFNDTKCCSRVAWHTVTNVRTQKNVYILVYARKHFWADGRSDGSEVVPYIRGEESEAILRTIID
jgi:hypothetical protein